MVRGERQYQDRSERFQNWNGNDKNGEARKGREGGRSPGLSPTNVPTPTRGGRSGERGQRNATVLEDIMRKRGVDEAWTALEEMQQTGVPTDKYTVSRMLMKTVGDGRSRLNPSRIYRGIGLVEKFIELQPKEVDEVLLNALLDTCCRLKDLNRLESIMQRMRDLQITPSPVTLGILVKTYGQAGDIQKVLQVWNEMEKQRAQANAVTYGCMIDACVKCGHLDKAVEIFKGMRETGKHRNTILYTTLIKGYGLEKDLASALEMFREMPRENVPYNTITYNSIIDACVKSGDLATAEALLREITSPTCPLEPDLITFSTLLKGYCHGGDLDKALQVAEAIKSRGLRCDELVYNTLMDGCVKANDVQAGVGLFEEMVQNGMRPSAITNSILARLYQRAGYEEDANDAVNQLYQHHGIERPAGGDRCRSGGNRHRNNQRSPMHGPSPTASPMTGYGMHHEGGWGAWSESGYDCYTDLSAASTPYGSPMQQGGNGHNGLLLPMDAMQAVPPLPGMNGSETPYSSCAGSGYGSFASSPYMSPMSMDQQHNQGALMSPHGQMVSATSSAPMPQLPAWPFAGNAMPGTPCNAPAVDSSGQQYFVVQPGPGNPGMPPAVGNMMQNVGVPVNGMAQADGSYGCGSPASFGAPSWQGQPANPQQSPFPMPLSAPHDLAQSCTPSQPQEAYFQPMSDGGMGSQNPFCL